MDPHQFLDHLCRRYGLPPRQAEPLLPLVQLAWTARPAVRRRILGRLEGALGQSYLATGPGPPAEGEGADRRLLELLASVLHNWKVDQGPLP